MGLNGLVSRWTAGGGGGSSVIYSFDERGNTIQRYTASGYLISSHVTDAFGTTQSDAPPAWIAGDPFAGFGGAMGIPDRRGDWLRTTVRKRFPNLTEQLEAFGGKTPAKPTLNRKPGVQPAPPKNTGGTVGGTTL